MCDINCGKIRHKCKLRVTGADRYEIYMVVNKDGKCVFYVLFLDNICSKEYNNHWGKILDK